MLAGSRSIRRGAAGRLAASLSRSPNAVPKRVSIAPARPLRGQSASFSDSAADVVTKYATSLQWVHWATAGGVLGCFGLVYAADRAKPETKAALMRWHSQIGMLVLGLVGGRIALRATTKVPPHLPGPAWEKYSAQAVHALMYPLMFSIPATGVAMGYFGGGGIPFFVGRIPGKDKPTDDDMKTAKDSTDYHKWLGSFMEILVPMHIAATGYHVAFGRDPLSRMAPAEMLSVSAKLQQAWAKRPGAVMAGAGMAAWGGAWLAWNFADYVFTGSDEPLVAPAAAGQQGRVVTVDELELHNKEDDLWIAVDGKVYDMTKYHKMHPGFGGPQIIVKNAGADASAGFRKAKHSPKANAIKDGLLIGELERNVKSELAKVMNLDDMKKRAMEVLSPGALAYYNAGAEDGTSMEEALSVWDRDWRLRPRNFIDVSNVDLSTTVLGHKLEVPIMAAPTALLKMGHEDGEAAVARGCAATGVGNCLSTTASLSIEDVAAASPECYRWFQLYVYRDHEKTKNLVLRAAENGYSAICLTVDLPVLGNRTSLKRIGFKVPKEFKMANVAKEKETEADKQAAKEGVNVKDPGDRAAYVAKLYDQSLTLELLTWLGTLTDLPIVVKGILRGDSAEMAARHPNVRAIIVSNHGGRQLDNCIAPLTALPEIVRVVNKVNIDREKMGLEPCEVIVDGGIKRGRDIFKALALGAKAVMLGRPMIYGMAVGGELGVARTVEVLRDELKTIMQLSGTQTTAQIDRSFILRHGTDTSRDDFDPMGQMDRLSGQAEAAAVAVAPDTAQVAPVAAPIPAAPSSAEN